MLLSIEPDGPVPIYQQIRDRIVEAIARGTQPAGSALPPIRQLAVDLGVNFHTVNKGYDLLRQEGLLRLGRKSGAVVRRDPGSGPPDPGWAQDWTGQASHAARRGRRPGDAGLRHPRGLPGRHGGLRLPGRGSRSGDRKRNRAMNGASLAGALTVLVVGGLSCVAPAIARPAVQFGVRIPRERLGAPVIRRERRVYYWRTAAVAVGCTAVAVAVAGYGPPWLTRIVLLPEMAADFGCFWAARRKITAVKTTDNWFAGLRQTIVADTSWRTDPPRFPVRWLIPALAVVAATVAVGALRYPGLPAHIGTGSAHRLSKAAASVLVVAGQLYITALCTGLMLVVYRSRPDIEAADAAASTLRYRRFLAAYTRAVLTLAALADITLLLVGLREWHVFAPSGPARPC